MELSRVKEIENAIAHNELSPAQVFTQMKQLVYRETPCYAFCEGKAFKSNIKGLESEIDQLRAELEQAKKKIESVSGDALTNFYKLVEFEASLPIKKADAICEAAKECLSEGRLRNGTMRAFCFASDLHQYAEKVRRGEV